VVFDCDCIVLKQVVNVSLVSSEGLLLVLLLLCSNTVKPGHYRTIAAKFKKISPVRPYGD